MLGIERIVYKHILQNVPGTEDFLWYFDNVIRNFNFCRFKTFRFVVHCTRMSGEMNTSSGNGIYNLISTMFLYYQKYGEEAFELKIYIEGDDGIHRELGTGLTPEDYARVGLNTKIQKSNNLTELSFCGIVMDEKDMINVTDPMSYISDFFWLNKKYFAASERKLQLLLKCKAYSTLFQYPGMPILYELAKTVLRLIPNIEPTNEFIKATMNTYLSEEYFNNREEYLRNPEMFEIEVPLNTRLLVEKLYSIPILAQYKIEQEIRQTQQLPIIFSTHIYNYIPYCYQLFYDEYTFNKSILLGATTYPKELMEKPPLIRMERIYNNIQTILSKPSKYNKLFKYTFDGIRH